MSDPDRLEREGPGPVARAIPVAVDQMVTRLFALVHEALAGATMALLDQDRELGQSVIAGDLAIDELTARVEQSIWEVISREALDASSLRYAVVTLLILPELERSADLAEHIAQRALTDLGSDLTPACRGLVQRMSEVASAMWDTATIAYVARSAVGVELDEADEELDVLHERLSHDVARGDMIPSVAAQVTLLARFYERLGDHAVNLARRMEALPPRPAERSPHADRGALDPAVVELRPGYPRRSPARRQPGHAASSGRQA